MGLGFARRLQPLFHWKNAPVLDVSAPEAMLRVLVLLIPVCVLALLVALATRKHFRRRAGYISPMSMINDSKPSEATPQFRAQEAEPDTMQIVLRSEETLARSLEDRIKAAESTRQTSELAWLYLELSRRHQAENRDKDAIAALGSAAGIAAKYGPKSVHAEARLELAEWAHKAGDLITACEQWQMARSALQDDGQVKASARVDQRMRDNGCPTDWVLTDF